MADRRDTTAFRKLMLVTAVAIAGIGAIIACLSTMGAPRHLLGMVSELCLTAGHVASELTSVVLAAVVVVSIGAGIATLLATSIRTRSFLRSLVRTRISSERLERAAQQAGVGRRVQLVRDQRMLAFSHGLLSPRVVVSSAAIEALSDEQLTAVLAHEAHHVRRRDPARLVIAQTATRAFFWLPILADLRRSWEVSAEIAADANAVARMRCNKPLAGALLRFADDQPTTAIAHLTGRENRADRLRLLLAPDAKLPPAVSARSSLLSLASAGVVHALVLVHLSLPGM